LTKDYIITFGIKPDGPNVQDYRPLGHYKVLEEEENSFKIKRITVSQGKN